MAVNEIKGPEEQGASSSGVTGSAAYGGAPRTRATNSEILDPLMPARGPSSVEDRVARATALLRQHTDAGWKAVEDTVISRTLALFRPSAPIRGRHDLGDFFLAADVVVTHLRRHIDAVPRAAAQEIACTTGDRDELEQVTIQLIAAYGAPLLDVAGHVHAVALDVLRDLLGVLAPAAEHVRTHVHIGDGSNDPSIVA